MNTPLEHSLEVLDDEGNVVWRAELEEVADDTDPDAGKYFNAVTTWHGLSRGGNAQGKLVYANYGRKEDFDALVEQGEFSALDREYGQRWNGRRRRRYERCDRYHSLRGYLPWSEGAPVS